jgi:hypothetical protein
VPHGEKKMNQEEIDKLPGANLEANSTKRFDPTAFAFKGRSVEIGME